MTAAPVKAQWWEAAPLATEDQWWEAVPVAEDQFFPPRTDIENSELLALLAPVDRKAIDTDREDVAAALAEKGRPAPLGRVTPEQAQRDLGRPVAGATMTRSAAGEIGAGLGRGLMLALEGFAGVAEMTTLPRRAGMPPLTAIPRGIGRQALGPSTEVAEGPIFDWQSWRWWAARGPEVVGTMLPALIPGVGAAALASRAGLSASLVTAIAASVGGTVAGAIEGGLSFETMRDKLIERGYSPEDAEKIARVGALAYGVAAGITEVVPLTFIFKRVPGAKKLLVKTLLSAIAEGGQEAVQTILERTAQVLTDADPSALEFDEDFREELKAAAALGAGAGGVAAVVVSAAQGKPPTETPTEPAPAPRRYAPSDLTSREGLMKFARENPDLALKLSKRAVPSRKDMSRLTPSGMSMSESQRREMGDLLRTEVMPALRKEARGRQPRQIVASLRQNPDREATELLTPEGEMVVFQGVAAGARSSWVTANPSVAAEYAKARPGGEVHVIRVGDLPEITDESGEPIAAREFFKTRSQLGVGDPQLLKPIATLPVAEFEQEVPRAQEEREVRAVRPAREGEQPPQERVGAEARQPIRSVPREPEAAAKARAEVAEVPRETAKQPWEMTREEYFNDQERVAKDTAAATGAKKWKVKWINLEDRAARRPFFKQENVVEAPSRKAAIEQQRSKFPPPKYGTYTASPVKAAVPDTAELFERGKAFHRASVEQALSEGKPVPPEVLADYPDLKPTEAAKKKAIKREPKGQLKFAEKPPDARHGGFVAIPSTPAGGRGPQSPGGRRIESGLPPVEIYGKPKDISAAQRYIMATQNAAIQSKNPQIIGAVETMIDLDIQRIQDTETELAEDRAQFRRLPKAYRKNNGAKLFALMDEFIPPDQIDSRADIPDDVKPVLRHFKNRSEAQRLVILDRKRELARSVAKQQTGRQLLRNLKTLAPNRFEGRRSTVAGKPVIRIFDKEQDRLLKKAEVTDLVAELAYSDDWGRQYEYIHHAFFGEYVLTWVDTEGGSHFIGRAETQAEAYDKLHAFRLQNQDVPIERLKAVPEVFMPPDVTRVSTGRLRVLQGQLKKAANLNSAEVQDALRGVVGQRRSRQKFWGALRQRKGAKGFEQDFWRVWETQTTMFHRWSRLTQMNREVVPVIEAIRGQGLPGWAEHLQNTLDYVWGRKRGVLSERVDRMLQGTPLLGRFLKPFALERSLSMIRTVNFYRHLQTVRFYVLNRFQPLQTLWPVVGSRGMVRGYMLRYSAKGREILHRHRVSSQLGKLREEEMVTKFGRRLRRFLPAGASEIENQRIAFLALYDYGRRSLKLDDAAAARYARLRGQVYTQFLFTRADQPAILRPALAQTAGQYKRFAIKNLGLLANLATNGKYGGVARWVAAQLFIGGLRAIWPRTILGMIGRGGLLFLLWTDLKDELGEERARAILYGLPSLIGVDMSGSVNVLEFPRGESAAERLGNLLFGPTLQTAAEVTSAVLLEKKAVQEHGLLTGAKQLLASSPTFRQFEALAKALSKDTTTFDVKGRKRHELELKDMWKKAFGFRPISESTVSLEIDRLFALQRIYDKAADRSAIRWATGDRDGAIRELELWNARFPDIPMTLADVKRRAQSRAQLPEKGLLERQIRARPKKVRAQAAREGITVGAP